MKRRTPRSPAWLMAALVLTCNACGNGTGATPENQQSAGWELTVYYTPVEHYHGGPSEAVSDCSGASVGAHPRDFLTRIRTEGFGRLTAPISGKSYLGWDFDRACWLAATAPLAGNDHGLRPWISTAAHASIAFGTRLRVARCGGPIEQAACDRVRAANWIVEDRFSGGGGSRKHLDLYIGEEDHPNFEGTDQYYFDSRGATVKFL